MIEIRRNSDIAVISTAGGSWSVMHDAARPHAVVEFHRRGHLSQVISRHATRRGADLACGKLLRARAWELSKG